MSYDLYFWRYENEADFPPGKKPVFVAHMNALVDGPAPAEIAALATDEVIESVSANLKAAGWKADDIFWDRKGAAIETFYGSHHASFSMRGSWQGDDANFLIDIMKEFDCPLFDPQVGERFGL